MLESRPGGATKEVLRRFADRLQGDIFAVDQQNFVSQVTPAIKMLATDSPERALLGDSWRALNRITEKMSFRYGVLDRYMLNPEEVTDAQMEDYARSIDAPGSREISLTKLLQQLHNLSVPNLEESADSLGLLVRTRRDDIFYKLFLAINGKVYSTAIDRRLPRNTEHN